MKREKELIKPKGIVFRRAFDVGVHIIFEYILWNGRSSQNLPEKRKRQECHEKQRDNSVTKADEAETIADQWADQAEEDKRNCFASLLLVFLGKRNVSG